MAPRLRPRIGFTPAPTWATAHPPGGGGLQAGGRRSPDAGAEERLRRHTLQRSGQRGHLRHGVEEPGAAGHAGLAAGDGAGAVVGGAGQRGDGGLWRAFGGQRAAGGVRLADRCDHGGSPQVLGKQYNEAASEDMARTVAHRFADEIISRLGGGINGIAETKIYFVSNRTGSKEIWAMDYDGQNQHAVTHLGTISMSPRISPDSSRIAFSSLGSEGWAIRMYSLELGRMVSFPAGTAGGSNLSPAWSADGTKMAFSSARSGHPEIWVADASGGNLHQVTSFGADVSPVWNPRTGTQLGLCERAHRRAADLHHGPGWRQRAAHDRQRLCDLAVVVVQRRDAGLQLESQVRSRRSRRAGHLRDGHRQQALAAGDARGGQQRFSVVVAGWTAHRVPARDQAPHADLVDAGRRHGTAATDLSGDNSMPNWSWK